MVKLALTQFGLYLTSTILLYFSLYLSLPNFSETEFGPFTVPEAWEGLTLMSLFMLPLVVGYVGFVNLTTKSSIRKLIIAFVGLILCFLWFFLTAFSVTDVSGAGRVIPTTAKFIGYLSLIVFFSQITIGWWLLFRKP